VILLVGLIIIGVSGDMEKEFRSSGVAGVTDDTVCAGSLD
jgi:hypothetical protein